MNRERRESDYPADLESQFILRLPEEPARELRELLQSGANLKDRLTIQLENDMRYGEVRFDHRLMHARIVDLPTIIESMKTIDNKSFYKTADICQMMICKDEPEQPLPEEESPKNKKKDPYKVDKKFLWPHGLAPPSKNVRKRRFRKTLKKKYVEAPEIEKEVKRLLRVDNEAVSVTWEVVQEEEETAKGETAVPAGNKTEKTKVKLEGARNSKLEPSSSSLKPESSNVVDIFGGAVSDSDLENDDDNINVEMEDTSRMSAYDSRLSDSSSMQGVGGGGGGSDSGRLPTHFRSDMFPGAYAPDPQPSVPHNRSDTPASHFSRSGAISSEDEADYPPQTITRDSITARMEQLSAEIEDLKQQRQKTQHEISGIENLALRQRFETNLENLQQDIMYKELEYQDLLSLQQQTDE